MFDWLYKQANLQSMCSIPSMATRPEYQHDLAKLGRRKWAFCSPLPIKAGSTLQLRVKGKLQPEVPTSSSQKGKEQICVSSRLRPPV